MRTQTWIAKVKFATFKSGRVSVKIQHSVTADTWFLARQQAAVALRCDPDALIVTPA